MDSKVLEKLRNLTEKKDDHLIYLNNDHRFQYENQRYLATHVRFFEKHGRNPRVGVQLIKTCDVKKCIEHFIEPPPTKKRKRKSAELDGLKEEENSDDQLENPNIKDFSEEYRELLMKRIDSYCKPSKPKSNIHGECRIWQEHSQNGYGYIQIQNKSCIVSRVAYQLHYLVDIPDGHHVRHLCGNSLCTTKEHLATGTPAQNAADKAATCTAQVGENHPGCKYSNEIIRQILESTHLTDHECALHFGMSYDYVFKVRHGYFRNDISKLHARKKPKLIKKELIPEYEAQAKAYILKNCTLWTDQKGENHWMWDLNKQPTGHGKANFYNKYYPAHTLAYRAWNGCAPLGRGRVIRHKCRYPSCVNPDHLEPGTHVQNQADTIRDGTDCRGEKNWQASLKDSFVRHLKCIRKVTTQKERADWFNVPLYTIQKIDRHVIYAHIETDDEYDDTMDSYEEWQLSASEDEEESASDEE